MELRSAAHMALERLDTAYCNDNEREDDYYLSAITALRAALDAPEVALTFPRSDGSGGWTIDPVFLSRIRGAMQPDEFFRAGMEEVEATLLALEAMPARYFVAQRKPLTDEEIDRVTEAQWSGTEDKPIYLAYRAYARAVERAHGIGGGDEPR